MSIRTSAAIATCKAVYKVMRLLGRTARAMPGLVALQVDPNIIAKEREAQRQGSYLPGPLTDFFDELSQKCQFRLWFLGHYHGNVVVKDRFLILYDQILRLSGPE